MCFALCAMCLSFSSVLLIEMFFCVFQINQLYWLWLEKHTEKRILCFSLFSSVLLSIVCLHRNFLLERMRSLLVFFRFWCEMRLRSQIVLWVDNIYYYTRIYTVRKWISVVPCHCRFCFVVSILFFLFWRFFLL